MSHRGDITLGDTIDLYFTTVGTTGAPTQLAGTPVISAYVGNSTTQLTAGITLDVDFDAVTGLNHVRVVATSGNGYSTGTNVDLVITTGTVGGTSVVGYVVGSFSIGARSAFVRLGAPAGASTAADIAAIQAKTVNLPAAPAAVSDCITAAGVRTAVGLASANIDTQLGTIAAYVDTVESRLPAALVGGRMDSTVSAIDGDTTALAAFKAAVRTNVTGTVGAASSTTSVVTSSMTPAASVADQFKGLIIKFDLNTSTAALRGQASDITASTAGGVLTVTALTNAPANGDTFAIL